MGSKFGEVTKEIRNKTGESLRKMAIRLGISASFLSIMEVGRKNVPSFYAEKIRDIYQLDDETYMRLIDAIAESNQNVNIKIDEMNEAQREVSMIFARRIKDADPDLIAKLKKALEDE